MPKYKQYKWFLPVLMVALVFSMVAGMLGTVAASPAQVPSAAPASNPGTGNSAANQALKPIPGKVVDGVACTDIQKFGIDRQTNMHAAYIMAACGLSGVGAAGTMPKSGGNMALPANYGGTDVDVILPDNTGTHVTQSESFVWGHGNTVVVNYNDSRTAPSCYSGLSYSTDGGATFHAGQPLCSGHGANFGDPTVVWDNAHSKWVATDLAGGCGGQGVGAWTSPDAITWTAAGCVLSSSQGDRNSSWVDDNPASSHYGTVYVSYNDFNVGGGALYVARSTDAGTTWTATQLNPAFIRDVQLTGAADSVGTVLEASMNENGGGLGNRNNVFYRSTDGGVTFTQVYSGPAFYGAGRSASGYFAGMYSNPTGYWRYMSWGQPAAGPQIGGQNVFHYVYTMGIQGTDPGNVMYIRSTDNGVTWSAPLQLNTDSTTKAQWMPSLSVSSSGAVFATWFDERNNGGSCAAPGTNTPCYQYYGRLSLDNGATWQTDQAVSDAISPLPAQPDANIQTLYVGDYNYASADGNTAYTTWVDGRTLIGGQSQQDVYFDKVNVTVGTPTPTVTGTPPTNTPTSTNTNTPTITPTPCLSPNVIQNPGFETGSLPPWTILGSNNPPTVSTAQAHSGTHSALMGTLSGGEPNGDSSIYETVTVPLGNPQLSYYYWPFTTDTISFDWQDAYVVSTTGTILATVMHVDENTQAWTNKTFDMTPYAGQTVRIEFLVHEDGFGDDTAMYVDDVSLQSPVSCGTATPTVTGTPPTPTRTNTPPPATSTPTPNPCGYRVLIAYSDTGGQPSNLVTAIQAEPGVTAVDLFDASAGTPTLSQLQQYDEVVAFSNNPWADATGMGNVLADYQDAGGIVVVTTFAFDNRGGWLLAGRWITGGYTPFTPSAVTDFSNASLGTFIAGHPLMQGVNSLSAFYRNGVTLSAGATQVATYTDSVPLLATKVISGHTGIAINGYLGYLNQFSGDWGHLIVNAARWLKTCATATPTVTGTPPTNTPTTTPSPTITGTPPTATPTPCQVNSTWQQEANGPTDAYGSSASGDGTVGYFAGGYSFSSGQTLSQFAKYNPSSNTWTTLASMTGADAANSMSSVVYSPLNNKVYVFGGEDAASGTNYNDTRIYDVAGNTWSAGTAMPDLRSFAASGYYNGKIYIVSGYNTGQVTSAQPTVWEYDVAADSWLTKTNIPHATGGAGYGVINGKLYVIGGRDATNTVIADTQIYDIATDTWTTGMSLPSPDNVPGSAVLNGQLYIYGGGNPFLGSNTRSLLMHTPSTTGATEIYDPASNAWSSGPTMNTARSFPGGTTVGNYAVAYGGYNGSSTTNSTEVLQVASCGTPAPTDTPAATNTPVATDTETPVPATDTATAVPATDTPVITATNTPVITATNTPAAPTVTPTDCPNPFVDISGNVFYVAIHYLNCRGVVNGVDATHYGPGGTSTRGQFAKVVVLGFGIPLSTPTGGQSFTDVPPSYFAYVYIESGFANGVLNGFDAAGCTSHGATFPCYLPNLAITRGQLTKLVVSAGHYPLYTPTTPDFTDVPPSNVFYVSIETAFHNSVISGYPDHTFRPNNNIRRDEMAQIVFEGIVHMP